MYKNECYKYTYKKKKRALVNNIHIYTESAHMYFKN